MTPEELRKARDLSQEEIAKAPAGGRKAGEAHGYAYQQPAPLYRSSRRETGDYDPLPGARVVINNVGDAGVTS